jgi:hypothetical protein
MKLKERLMSDLGLKPSEFKALCDRVGVASKAEYSPEEEALLMDAVTRPQSPKSPKGQGLQAVNASTAQGGITFVQEAMDGAAREGVAIARKRVVTRFTAMVQEENRLMEEGFAHLRSLDGAIEAVDVAWSIEDEEGGMGDFFGHLFPESTPKALPSNG